MARQAVQRRPRFNATEYKEDFLDLIKTNPEMAADSAKRLAGRKVKAENQVADADEATRDLVGFMIAAVATAAVGWWSGSMRAKRDAIVADWELEGAESVGANIGETRHPWEHERGVADPTKLWFVPKLLFVPLGTGLLAVGAAALRKKGMPAGIFEKGMVMATVSTFGLTVASITGGIAYDRRERHYVTEAPNSVAANGAVLPAA